MNKPAVTLSILALLAGAGVWWLQGHGPARETARPSAEATPVAHEDQPVALEKPPADAPSAETASLTAPAEAGKDRRAMELPSAGRGLKGRVLLPANAPADPTLRVLALSKSLAMSEIYGEEGVRFYTRYKSVMQRWPNAGAKGPEFTMPTHD